MERIDQYSSNFSEKNRRASGSVSKNRLNWKLRRIRKAVEEQCVVCWNTDHKDKVHLNPYYCKTYVKRKKNKDACGSITPDGTIHKKNNIFGIVT